MKFKIKKIERLAIKWALKQKDPWGVDGSKSPLRHDPRAQCITDLKNRLKAYHLKAQDDSCAYCKTPLLARIIETDREHIIPKNDLRIHTFTPYNISVACKRCNLTVKGTTKKHLVNWRRIKRIKYLNILDERNYNIVHPNIHYWHDHIDLYSEQVNQSSVRIYFPLDRRGRVTYNLFELKDLEVCRNTEAQRTIVKNRRGIHPEILKVKKRFNQ